MAPTQLLDDATIEAILVGDLPAAHSPLAAFTAAAREIGDRPAPRPSPELAHLITNGSVTATATAPIAAEPAPASLDTRRRRRHTLAKVAGLGMVAKVGLAASAAAAGVVGAGAAGMLPGEASRVVRDAIEVVTPVDFPGDEQTDRLDEGDRDGVADDTGDGPDADGTGDPSDPGEHGDRVSGDATGNSDGDPGVDGAAISDDAPGASHRPSETPAQEDAPGPPADAGTPPVTVAPVVPGSSSPSSTAGQPGGETPAPSPRPDSGDAATGSPAP
ncbi:MAG TPA: hypothetical protein VFY82_12165 [Acidimicrobiales bacterium]|nr:hypothetical protein [Acidimicrobiales bacterium]